MNRVEARSLIERVSAEWVADPGSDVVWAGEYEGRLGIRMAQQTRDFTTMWFEIGDLTVRFEAYLTPAPATNAGEVYRLVAARSYRSWPAHLAADRRGDIYVVGRIPLGGLSARAIDEAVGSVYELVELTFRPILRTGFPSREKQI